MNLIGKISSDNILTLKFGLGGTLSKIAYQTGQTVKKGVLLAQLNQTELQTYLDRALKYYDQVRADFDEKQGVKLDEYETRKRQAELEVSIKNVEIAKANLEATNLYAPNDGLIVDADPAAIGINITPGSFTITFLDTKTLYFLATAIEDQLSSLTIGKDVNVTLKAFPSVNLTGKIYFIGFQPVKEGDYPVKISLSSTDNLRLGLTGSASF